MMRFLWQSNAPWAGTGYGQQTRLVLKGLKDLGHEPACFAFYGLSGGTVEYDGYPVLPNSDYDTWGNDVVKAHAFRTEAEAVVSLIDLFVLKPENWAELQVPWLAWVPIDSEGLGYQTLVRLKLVDYPIAMSMFGAEQMREAGIEPAMYIPHCVDTDVFKPMEDRYAWRDQLGIGRDTFLIGMVMANKGDRKQFPAQFEAVKRWIDEHPDREVVLYLHTEPTDAMAGWNIKRLTDLVGLTGKVLVTNQYDSKVVPASPEMMAQIYNSFDVLLNVSGGEGFGIPIIEAQACGVPVITGNWTSMPELTRYGYTVEPQAKVLAQHYGYQFVPSVDDIVYRLECVYRMGNKADSLDGVAWVQENFNVARVANLWSAALQACVADHNEKSKAKPVTRRPTPVLTTTILQARGAMDAERGEYGELHHRVPEYKVIHEELLRYGLQDGDRILDLGAADCDLDHYLRAQGWKGVYSPVDMIIDGTDLHNYDPPLGFDFIVAEQVIEHLRNWRDLLTKCEGTGAVVVVATPNGEVVAHEDKHDLHDQMAHVDWISPTELNEMGYEVMLHEFTGQGPGDTIIASKWNGVADNGNDRSEFVEVAAGGSGD